MLQVSVAEEEKPDLHTSIGVWEEFALQKHEVLYEDIYAWMVLPECSGLRHCGPSHYFACVVLIVRRVMVYKLEKSTFPPFICV